MNVISFFSSLSLSLSVLCGQEHERLLFLFVTFNFGCKQEDNFVVTKKRAREKKTSSIL